MLTQADRARLREMEFTDAQLDAMRPAEGVAILADEKTFYAELQNDPAAWSEFEARVLRPGTGDGSLSIRS